MGIDGSDELLLLVSLVVFDLLALLERADLAGLRELMGGLAVWLMAVAALCVRCSALGRVGCDLLLWMVWWN